MTRVTPLRVLLAASIGLNVLLLWSVIHKPKSHGSQELPSTAVDQTRMELFRVLPKDFYTRNEFALALTYATDRPIVRDCMVKTRNTVYVFDRTNTLIGMYPPGPNPFVPDPVASLERGYKCNSSLLDAQTQTRITAARQPDHHLEASRAALKEQMAQDGPEWGVRGVWPNPSTPK
jgi:hypothetical protein